MTEPPEPRRPEEGGGAEDYDAAWDDIGPDDLLDGLEDDALLDTIRDGVRGDLGPDALTELLARIRDQPDEHDPRGLHLPNLGRVERGENVLEPPGPRQTSEGNTPEMPASEDAERLRNIATSQDFPTPRIRAAADAVDGILAQVLNIIGEQSQHRDTVVGHANLAKDKAGEAIAAFIQFESAIHNAADGHARG